MKDNHISAKNIYHVLKTAGSQPKKVSLRPEYKVALLQRGIDTVAMRNSTSKAEQAYLQSSM